MTDRIKWRVVSREPERRSLTGTLQRLRTSLVRTGMHVRLRPDNMPFEVEVSSRRRDQASAGAEIADMLSFATSRNPQGSRTRGPQAFDVAYW